MYLRNSYSIHFLYYKFFFLLFRIEKFLIPYRDERLKKTKM